MKDIQVSYDCFVKGKPYKSGQILTDVDNLLAAEFLTCGCAKLASKKDVEKLQSARDVTPAPKKKAAKKAAKKEAKNIEG